MEHLICTKHIAGHSIILIGKPSRWIFLLPLQKLSLKDIKLLVQGHTVGKPKARIQTQIRPEKPSIFAPLNQIYLALHAAPPQ